MRFKKSKYKLEIKFESVHTITINFNILYLIIDYFYGCQIYIKIIFRNNTKRR
jgi:hypothetical protein